MSRENVSRRGSEKRRAIIDGAREVFGRDGYARASIDTIAKAAEVSTRTIYNHFADKGELFREVILESAAAVRDAQLADLDRHLGKIVDLRSDLIGLGRDFAAAMPEFEAHFFLVRQINADVGHIPAEVVEEWQAAGPRQVQADLARRLAELSDRGLLEIDDPQRAAVHFVLLVAGEVQSLTFWGARSIDEDEVEAIVAAGVEVFLRAYRPR
ncbi:TetR/AcrR family transcriptional regulator [Saccharopolyspora elongata]|uniref:TetR/AcrR family transcriptional regulator n=1 Tax=Saccharopolyspora elongata TaxID=2530387 RepID=A0A4R4YRT1_9PSEU|nr:TetR/AcrR family transcriptional regulator [Saccharopolyspora elongata]TDD47893.1 TetR/AcrR family transcriptional regulator [Saccharopolyspora elongata]